ncbi:MAG TPA: glucose 1-dehydrogenase [Candidatus Kapabacteria bacterium]
MSYLADLFSLEGKTAIVTGASRGLGRAIAIALNGAGSNVVLIGRNSEELLITQDLLALRQKSSVVQCDVTSVHEMTLAFEKAEVQFGSVDILVNNAGIIRRNAALDYTEEDWDAVLETNLSSVFMWSQEAGKRMKANDGGKIINIASILSFSGGLNAVAYAAAKGGVAQITKTLANEWAKYNINVNAIAPGYFVTDATSTLRANQERSAYILSRIPTGRYGEPDELAGTAIFLASKASDYVNGHILAVDGGWNSM